MSQINPVRLGNSLAVAFALIHIGFDFLSLVSPKAVKLIFNSWFHGFNLKILVLEENFAFSLPKVILGLITSVALAWVIGFLIGFFYNYNKNYDKNTGR
ncbi:MAG: DUF5676 family membrane protein [Candidatus Woykebacteria bacterium]